MKGLGSGHFLSMYRYWKVQRSFISQWWTGSNQSLDSLGIHWTQRLYVCLWIYSSLCQSNVVCVMMSRSTRLSLNCIASLSTLLWKFSVWSLAVYTIAYIKSHKSEWTQVRYSPYGLACPKDRNFFPVDVKKISMSRELFLCAILLLRGNVRIRAG